MTNRPIIITCTQPRADEIVKDLAGYNAHACPALQVDSISSFSPSSEPDGDFDAMVISSLHALSSPDLPKNLPVIAVGDVTAAMARDKGFHVVQIGQGGVHDLNLSGYKAILYPCAIEPSHLPDNATAWPIYQTTLNPDFMIDDDDAIVCLFSVKGAQHYAEKCYMDTHQIICFSPTIADTIRENIPTINPERLAVCDRPGYDVMRKIILEVIGNE